MIHFFREVRSLQLEGKLHTKLISRVRMLFIISAILASATVYNLIFRGANPWTAGALAGIGFVLGLYVFSGMSAVNWNEEEEVVQASKMGTVGYVTIVSYIAFELSLRTFLHTYAPVSSTAFILACVAGTIFGRALGTLIEVHRVFKVTHLVS